MVNSPRTSVEWGFNKIQQRCRRIGVKHSLKTFGELKLQSLMANAAFLANCHTCMRGSQTNTYFASSPPTLEDYVNCGTTPQHAHF